MDEVSPNRILESVQNINSWRELVGLYIPNFRP